MTPLRGRLREATAGAHARLENLLGLGPGVLTVQRYGRALQVLHAIRAGWEPGLCAVLGEAAGPHRGWLEADLRHLGLPVLAAAAPLTLPGAAEAWGARYVLEGSALGGRALLRALAPLGLDATAGARYFAGEGEATGARWSAFLERLGAVAGAAAIIGGAVGAFEALERYAAGVSSRR